MKKFILTILAGFTLLFSSNAQVLNVPTIEQEQDLWCWAGVCKSALDYYGTVQDQCEIVEWVRSVKSGYGNDPCCENPSGPCNNENVLDNGDGSMSDILNHFHGITSEVKGQFGRTEQDVADAIQRNAVVPCAWAWTLGGGHAVLIHGYVDGNVYYMDPWFGEGKKISTYSEFSSGDDGSGHHNWTQGLYFTSDVSAVDTVPCETPLNLSASVSGTSVSLSWSVVASAQSYELQYREQGTSNWVSESVSSNSLNVNDLSPLTTYEFRVSSLCNSVSVSDFSSVISATTEDGPIVYCNSNGNSVASEWIQSVEIGSLNNVSNANGGYADFTSQSVSITAGTSESIILTPGFPYNWLYGTQTQPEFWSVWVDLNQDGDFTDANEQRFVSSSSSTSAVTASISIPSGTIEGTTRMRIAMKRGAAATSCESFANGEVEDYTINIIADVPPTCDVVTNLAVSSVTDNSLSVSWNGDVDASSYDVDIRENGGAWSTVNVNGTSHNFSGLIAETSYEVRVSTVCAFGSSDYSSSVSATTSAEPTCDVPSGLAVGNVSNNGFTASWNASSNASSYSLEIRENGGAWSSVSTSNTTYNFAGLNSETNYDVRVSAICSFGNSVVSSVLSVQTLAGPVEYCSASGTSANEWLEAISLGSISNSSGANGGYGDFTNQATNLELGESVNLSITPGFPYNWLWGYSTQPEFYSVWIDYNQDGDFDDSNELAFQSASSNSTYQAFNVNFIVPQNALIGETRMRIAMKRGAAATSCESYNNGEVEDYTVNIIESLGGNSATGVGNNDGLELSAKIYPNPANDQLFVLVNNLESFGEIELSLMDLSGKLVLVKSLNTSIDKPELLDVSSLKRGLYILTIKTDSGETKNQKVILK